MQIFLHWTPTRLNFCSLVSVNNLPKSITPHSPPLTLLETSVSYLMNTSLFLTRSHPSPNLAITIFVSFAVSIHTSIPKQLPSLPLLLFTPSLTTATPFITICPSLRSPGSNRSRTLLHVLLCQIQSHHSHPPVSALVKDNWVHWIQAPLTYHQWCRQERNVWLLPAWQVSQGILADTSVESIFSNFLLTNWRIH